MWELRKKCNCFTVDLNLWIHNEKNLIDRGLNGPHYAFSISFHLYWYTYSKALLEDLSLSSNIRKKQVNNVVELNHEVLETESVKSIQ